MKHSRTIHLDIDVIIDDRRRGGTRAVIREDDLRAEVVAKLRLLADDLEAGLGSL